jgi:hypothetical protein
LALLTLDEEKLLVWFGCSNLEFTKKRITAVCLYATCDDFKKTVVGLLGKLNTEDIESVYPDMFYDISAENEMKKSKNYLTWS